MNWEPLLALPVLALADGTSVGTLLLPAWLMLAPRVRSGAVLGYLLVVASTYWLLGLALLLGADLILSALERAGDTSARPVPVLIAQFVLGAALLAWAVLPDRWRRGQRAGGSPGPLLRWRDRVARGEARGGILILALVAVLLEAATMLPYLGAVTLLAGAGLDEGLPMLMLAGYCAVMIAPALLLLLARTIAARRVEPVLQRLERWSRRAGGEALLWVAGIAGVLLARDALVALGVL